MAAEVSALGDVVDVGAPRPLFGPITVTSAGYQYDVSADGQRFLALTAAEQKAVEPLTLVQNWTAALKR